MTDSKRQPYGFGSFVKKFTRPIKKIVKSPLGKAALLGGGLYGLNKFGIPGMSGTGSGWAGKLGKMFGKDRLLSGLIRNKEGKLSLGKMGLMGLLGAGTALPFLGGGDEEEEIIETPWETTSSSIANIRDMAKNRDSSLAFLPSSIYAQPGYYNMAQGGIAGLANGGNPAEAQAEQMLKMEYQKYRNQGGTMSYQKFKMQVLQQAQGQGPMAQGQPQMMNNGGRIGLRMGGNPHSDLPTMSEGVEQMYVSDGLGALPKSGGGVLPEDMGILEIDDFDEMEDYLRYLKVLENNTPNRPDELAQGGRIKKAEGGIMDLGGMEKDYRAEGGFVPIGGEEKADDVPARLSKNEFVFTADAVRNAGGGDIDAGADVMQNMMDNLEAGGQISEESQGGGGEEMISEEEIIEEPNGAQAMYEQQQMLQSRMA